MDWHGCVWTIYGDQLVWKCWPFGLVSLASRLGSHVGGRCDVDCLCVWFWTQSVSRFFRKWRQWLTGNVHCALWVRMHFKIHGFVCGSYFARRFRSSCNYEVPPSCLLPWLGDKYVVHAYVLGVETGLRELPVKIERLSASAPSRMTTETDQFTTHVGALTWFSGGQYLKIWIIQLGRMCYKHPFTRSQHTRFYSRVFNCGNHMEIIFACDRKLLCWSNPWCNVYGLRYMICYYCEHIVCAIYL